MISNWLIIATIPQFMPRSLYNFPGDKFLPLIYEAEWLELVRQSIEPGGVVHYRYYFTK